MKKPSIKTKDLLTIAELTEKEILDLFAFTADLKKEHKLGKKHSHLEGKTLAMIFEKSSTRTRVSFEAGVFQLGGHALFLSRDDIQLGRGETISDTSRVLSRYVDGIMIRAYAHEKVEELAQESSVPVINGLTDTYHPCQALADYYTIFEREKDLRGIKFAYVGDGNNVVHSLLLGAAILGIDIAIGCPKGYMPDRHVIEKAFQISSRTGSTINVTTDINLAVENANYLYTDVWVSMGQEKDAAKRRKALSAYKISRKLLNRCADNCRVMHCLPAHRGEEIDAEVIDSDRSIVFDQAENRLHVQKAILCALMAR